MTTLCLLATVDKLSSGIKNTILTLSTMYHWLNTQSLINYYVVISWWLCFNSTRFFHDRKNIFSTFTSVSFTGSNLKFKLTEFGTLEIISTVETEKGEITWSTQTEHRKSTSEETNDAVTKEGATTTTASKKDKGMWESVSVKRRLRTIVFTMQMRTWQQ